MSESLTIAGRGVRIFLQSANHNADASETLWRMALKRKQGTPEADALYAGHSCVDSLLRDDVQKLRDRGGLLHFGAAHVDYDEGRYTVRGLDLAPLGPRS